MPFATIPDLLRLLAVPVFAWAAWRDVETRRVPHRTWLPLVALAAITLIWETALAWSGTAFGLRLFLVRTAVSLGFVVPLSYLFWRIGGFGGADAKAFMVVAALFPTFPVYDLGGTFLPLQPTTLGVFSMTILTNTVLIAAAYPLALFVRNALAGRRSLVMLVGLPVSREAVLRTHGRLLETPDGPTRGGLDLDALRMYLRWRGSTLDDLVDDPVRYRDPATLPADPNAPGDGQVSIGGSVESTSADGRRSTVPSEPTVSVAECASPDSGGSDVADDPWGARAFLDDIEGSAYGTTPTTLREGLDVLVSRETIWVSPGIPFLVPLLFGLVVAFTYGDLLFGLLAVLGAV